jgi:SAM-dependent methyltransferase
MGFSATIGKQFRQPGGFLGRIIAFLMRNGNRSAYSIMIPLLNIQAEDLLLEIGYGHGYGIKRIMKNFTCSVHGIDFSKLMFKQASKLNRKAIKENRVNLFFGDIRTYTPFSMKYSKIYCLNVIYFWEELEIPFNRIKSMLQANGCFYIHMTHPDNLNRLKISQTPIFNKHTIDEVVNKLHVAGFEKVNYIFEKNDYYITARV